MYTLLYFKPIINILNGDCIQMSMWSMSMFIIFSKRVSPVSVLGTYAWLLNQINIIYLCIMTQSKPDIQMPESMYIATGHIMHDYRMAYKTLNEQHVHMSWTDKNIQFIEFLFWHYIVSMFKNVTKKCWQCIFSWMISASHLTPHI